MNKQIDLSNPSITLLYKNNDNTLLCSDDELCLIYKNDIYKITSYPYEPCLYIKKDDKVISIIHNSFNTDEIINVFINDTNITSISGLNYNKKLLFELLIYVIDNSLYDVDISYVEDKINENNNNTSFIELEDDEFYNIYHKYDDLEIDYFVLKNKDVYNDEESHKEAVIFSMNKLKAIFKKEYDFDIKYNKEKIKMKKISIEDLLDTSLLNQKSYYYLFLNPPHGSNYDINDFDKINRLLFPNGTKDIVVYEFTTDWSNYFDEGHEWWGMLCISIYDKSLDRFIVILASSTD